MSDKYRNIKYLPVSYRTLPSGKVVAFLVGCEVASVMLSDTLKKWFVQMKNISDELIECADKKECDRVVREHCFDYIMECVDPLWKAVQEDIQKELGDNFHVTGRVKM